MTWRRRVASLAGGMAYGTGLHRLLLRGRAVVAVFHRIDDRYPRDPITLGTRAFTEYCEFFARHFRVCSLGELLDALSGGGDLSRRLAITFDDGYRDNFTVAAPILESFGLTACFFVTTGFVASTVVPWWDQKQGITSEWMNWDQIAALRRGGHEIGAHTVSHPDLGQLEGENAGREIRDSKQAIEERLGEPVSLFAYPYGRAHQITEASQSLVREAGYRCCASSHGGIVLAGSDPWRLPRVPAVSWYHSARHYGASLLRERRAGP